MVEVIDVKAITVRCREDGVEFFSGVVGRLVVICLFSYTLLMMLCDDLPAPTDISNEGALCQCPTSIGWSSKKGKEIFLN